MFTRKPERVVFLPRHVSIESSIYENPGLPEKDFDPYALLDVPLTPPEKRMPGCISKLIGWPAMVVLGQILLQAMGWGFFLFVRARGAVPLPFESAVWVKNNGHLVTLLTTLIATVLAGSSSFLFSYAIRRSMALYLSRPVSLATLGASVSISMRSIVFHRRNWKWPTVSLFFFFLAGVQTSGWSTLLTPVTVIVSSPLVGSELDLSSQNLYEMYNKSVLNNCDFSQHGNAHASMSTLVGQSESGYAAARTSLAQPTTLTLMDRVFNVSTGMNMSQPLYIFTYRYVGGILPAFLVPIDVSAWFTTASVIPATTHNVGVENWDNDYRINGDLTWYKFSSTCESKNGWNSTNGFNLGNGEGNLMMMVACGPGPADNYTLVFTGNYMLTTFCQVTPKITTALVEYTSGNINVINPNITAPVVVQSGASGVSAVDALALLVYTSQGVFSNVVGNDLYAVGQDATSASHLKIQTVLGPLEEFIRGAMEYSGSMLRACLSTNVSFSEGVPLNMSIPTTGALFTETMGWSYESTAATRWVLVPGTLIAVFTICVVGVALYRHDGDLPRESDQFDPSNPLHLMAAAAAGGLDNAFKGLGHKDMKDGEKLDVVLGSIPGRGPALVRADQYRPVFADSFSPRSGELTG
ncbi:hypothetical protein DFH07DRAFT_967651 [Mycena maculata]|uniref:Uncharacterized protein n=1 Tax=Mycena maculata TaxID=230809 RepID=A0AAD7I549_9AGAR|nr:hypothetical protein DFH07DRAFT_967651 [Mycena maculata]